MLVLSRTPVSDGEKFVAERFIANLPNVTLKSACLGEIMWPGA
jgi:hypothetical protein